MSRYHIVRFEGGLINEKGQYAVDLHVVDERGRTQQIFDRHTHPHPGTRRNAAVRYAARLNGGEAPPVRHRIRGYRPRATQPNYSFRPTCPYCSVVCPIGARYCNECGARLYLNEDELAQLRSGVV